METFEVVVPEGATFPGAILRMKLPSSEVIDVPVPDGAQVGDTINFELNRESVDAVQQAMVEEQVMFVGKVQRGKKMKKPPEWSSTPTFEMTVPAGWITGHHTHFQAVLGDVISAIPVPRAAVPKSVLHVQTAAGWTGRNNLVDVTIPSHVVPGSQFVANVGGQLVNVPCPRHMKPGQVVSVAVADDTCCQLGEVRMYTKEKGGKFARSRSQASAANSPAAAPRRPGSARGHTPDSCEGSVREGAPASPASAEPSARPSPTKRVKGRLSSPFRRRS